MENDLLYNKDCRMVYYDSIRLGDDTKIAFMLYEIGPRSVVLWYQIALCFSSRIPWIHYRKWDNVDRGVVCSDGMLITISNGTMSLARRQCQ